MQKISVVIITFNEADRIEDTLKSCSAIADEIVVVDSYSTDATCEVVEKYGGIVYRHPFENYGAQKNIALEKAKYSWVLNLDADERISDELSRNIAEFKLGHTDKADGFEISRKTFYMGRWIKHSGWYPDRKIRLFRKDIASWRGVVHESLHVRGKIAPMAGDIIHYTYRDIADHIKRLNHYSSIQAGILSASRKWLYPRMILLPPVTFLRFFLWKAGFLDGFPGLVIAIVSSWSTAMKYMKAIALRKKANP